MTRLLCVSLLLFIRPSLAQSNRGQNPTDNNNVVIRLPAVFGSDHNTRVIVLKDPSRGGSIRWAGDSQAGVAVDSQSPKDRPPPNGPVTRRNPDLFAAPNPDPPYRTQGVTPPRPEQAGTAKTQLNERSQAGESLNRQPDPKPSIFFNPDSPTSGSNTRDAVRREPSPTQSKPTPTSSYPQSDLRHSSNFVPAATRTSQKNTNRRQNNERNTPPPSSPQTRSKNNNNLNIRQEEPPTQNPPLSQAVDVGAVPRTDARNSVAKSGQESTRNLRNQENTRSQRLVETQRTSAQNSVVAPPANTIKNRAELKAWLATNFPGWNVNIQDNQQSQPPVQNRNEASPAQPAFNQVRTRQETLTVGSEIIPQRPNGVNSNPPPPNNQMGTQTGQTIPPYPTNTPERQAVDISNTRQDSSGLPETMRRVGVSVQQNNRPPTNQQDNTLINQANAEGTMPRNPERVNANGMRGVGRQSPLNQDPPQIPQSQNNPNPPQNQQPALPQQPNRQRNTFRANQWQGVPDQPGRPGLPPLSNVQLPDLPPQMPVDSNANPTGLVPPAPIPPAQGLPTAVDGNVPPMFRLPNGLPGVNNQPPRTFPLLPVNRNGLLLPNSAVLRNTPTTTPEPTEAPEIEAGAVDFEPTPSPTPIPGLWRRRLPPNFFNGNPNPEQTNSNQRLNWARLQARRQGLNNGQGGLPQTGNSRNRFGPQAPPSENSVPNAPTDGAFGQRVPPERQNVFGLRPSSVNNLPRQAGPLSPNGNNQLRLREPIVKPPPTRPNPQSTNSNPPPQRARDSQNSTPGTNSQPTNPERTPKVQQAWVPPLQSTNSRSRTPQQPAGGQQTWTRRNPAETNRNRPNLPSPRPNPLGPDGIPTNGFPPNGFPPNGLPPNGLPPNNASPNGGFPNGISSRGMLPNGMSSNSNSRLMSGRMANIALHRRLLDQACGPSKIAQRRYQQQYMTFLNMQQRQRQAQLAMFRRNAAAQTGSAGTSPNGQQRGPFFPRGNMSPGMPQMGAPGMPPMGAPGMPQMGAPGMPQMGVPGMSSMAGMIPLVAPESPEINYQCITNESCGTTPTERARAVHTSQQASLDCQSRKTGLVCCLG